MPQPDGDEPPQRCAVRRFVLWLVHAEVRMPGFRLPCDSRNPACPPPATRLAMRCPKRLRRRCFGLTNITIRR